ncbi:hypothetical protein BaRGS_00025561 [Batillaria attramentaria]|uniref:Uncharacterized protein n=1 Tax=Batillaria attramentaria TaxID=370345 RepID=A0ABD0K6V4_9CAEN
MTSLYAPPTHRLLLQESINTTSPRRSDSQSRGNAVQTQAALKGVEFKSTPKPSGLLANRSGVVTPSPAPPTVSGGEVHHVVFVKVHKAASSTVMSILLRFALSHQLNVMLPRHGNILSSRSPKMGSIIEHPKSPPFHFDILCNHVIFDKAQIQPYFPANTKYLAILREPWERIQSAYHYFTEVLHVDYLKPVPSFEDYLRTPLRYEPRDALQSFTMNRMSTEMGLPQSQMWNASYTETFIKHLDETFHLVLIAEHFDESMILMKRLLRWQLQDILYVKINTHQHETTQKVGSDATLRARVEHLNHHDVAIYKHFLDVFRQKVAAEGPSFQEEVVVYTELLNQLQAFCADPKQDKRIFEATKWNEQFEVKASDCRLITMTAVPLIDHCAREQRNRMGIVRSRG